MARPLRIEYDRAVYHITSRGNARKAIYGDDADREIFLETLHKVTKRYNWLCHAYCLMNNHYHLVIETPDGNLSRGMRQLNGVYTQRYNARHYSVGHIFQGRYKAILIQKDSHLLEVSRYVVLNPVRAKAVPRLRSSGNGAVTEAQPAKRLRPPASRRIGYWGSWDREESRPKSATKSSFMPGSGRGECGTK